MSNATMCRCLDRSTLTRWNAVSGYYLDRKTFIEEGSVNLSKKPLIQSVLTFWWVLRKYWGLMPVPVTSNIMSVTCLQQKAFICISIFITFISNFNSTLWDTLERCHISHEGESFCCLMSSCVWIHKVSVWSWRDNRHGSDKKWYSWATPLCPSVIFSCTCPRF